jgi:hypothetical protein
MSQQQTLLRIETNIPHATISGATKSEYLDTYTDIPIKINKSISEIQDVAKRNSDFSIGLSLPGSKKNNRFFETFYNVDATSLYFNATKRVNCNVLIGSQVYFRGYMRLNKVSVLNSKVEYDVTLYSEVGDLFGKIGNNLLKDLNFDDSEYTFNHTFNFAAVGDRLAGSNFFKDSKYPYTYFYPIVHNGYNYENISDATLPNFTGNTEDRTRLYTTTSPIGWWSGTTAAYDANVKEYYANSPTQALYDNQFKPALNIYSLIQLIFKTYGYKINSDFFNTPWFKSMYLYGYFSSEATKFSYTITNIETLPPEGCELIFRDNGPTISAIICKRGTGIPCFCLSDVYGTLVWSTPPPAYFDSFTIQAGATGYTADDISGKTFSESESMMQASNVTYAPSSSLRYTPRPVGDSVSYQDGDAINFNLVIDQNIKQIDLLSSISKKFNLVFIPDENDPTTIKIEPFDFYIGTGNIYDWTPKLSYDKGFTVEPALNFIESQLTLTDLEDGDEGNRIFKNQNNRIYGQNIVYNPTDFKSQEKKIETIFSSELIRKWDNNVGLPLGINYAATNEISEADNQVRWLYKGVKSKPKIFYWLMGLNPFIDSVGEVYDAGNSGVNTYTFKLQNSTGGTASSYDRIPSISHTMPIGLADQYKINNDSLCLLFNSELPVDIGVQTYDVYTENDIYNIFYNNRITNIYDPNTRLLSGYFDLKYSDIQNLKWNDIIKINEQYFIVNKISELNLTNREMTKVELLQFNVNPQEYPDRYFKYSYCDNPSVCYKLKTDFTNQNLQDTNFIWSLYYDNQVGSLSGSTTGFTSAFQVFNTGSFQVQYVPYTMQEITSGSYVSSSCKDYTCDTMLNYIYNNPNGLQYSLAGFWVNSGTTKTGVNVWENCTDFNTTKTNYGIITGSSTTYGPTIC